MGWGGGVNGETKSWCIHCLQKEGPGKGLGFSPAVLAGGFRQVLGHLGQTLFRGRKDLRGWQFAPQLGADPGPLIKPCF